MGNKFFVLCFSLHENYLIVGYGARHNQSLPTEGAVAE